MKPLLAAIIILCSTATHAQDRPPPSPWYPITPTSVFQTGDTWTSNGAIFRLYGVQSCIRGTTFTNRAGAKTDCGEASLAMLVSLIRDLNPQCYTAALQAATNTNFVFCYAVLKGPQLQPARVDLGTALISTGFAFASIDPSGHPVHPPYFVAQALAQQQKAGLWAFDDLPDPNIIILKQLRGQGSSVPPPGPGPVPSLQPQPR